MGDLAARQAALEGHFRALAGARPGGRVFALEHGLDQAARADLDHQVRAHCAQHRPAVDHWLVWTVYAAERGYEYAGREYWQTFEKDTPGWHQRGNRNWIRESFQRFAETYSGFRPSGAWAERFSIICWPIVHAVLPRDLQERIARILYDVRHSFTAATLGSPRTLGTLIATRGWLGSTRLEQLADDVEVIGSIALALLFRDREHAGIPLLPCAIERIAEDLAQHRRARAWLNDAQSSAGAIALKGLRSPTKVVAPEPEQRPNAQQARRILDELGVQPAVYLAPGPDGWFVMLGLPNLAPLLTRFPELRDSLMHTRPTVHGSSGEPLARQRVLQGDERIRLRTWPASDQVLLVFDNAPELLRVVLSAECLLRPGPTWLFRIGSDKLAYELRGRVVRPGQQYIVLAQEQQPASAMNLTEERLACDGVWSYRLDVPDVVSDDYAQALSTLNLSVARAIRVRPAGLAAAGWDGSGFGEWLAGERPCLAVNADHAVESLSCKLPGAPEIVVPGTLLEDGAPVFVEFPELAVGAHIAEFELKASDGSVDRGQMELLVRDRRPWAPGLTHDGALTVIVDPPDPTLEDLWADRVTVDIHGPAGHSVECHVHFWNRPGRQRRPNRPPPLLLKLPVTRRRWRAVFRTSCRLQDDCQNAYDQSDGVTLNFVAPGVGRFELSAEREFAPLRWVARHKKSYSLRIQDDRGVEDSPPVDHYTFEAPAVAKRLPPRQFVADGQEVEGGLYVVLADELSQAIIVAPRTFHLHGVRHDPRVDPVESEVDAIVKLLEAIELWSRARQVGSAFSLRFAVPSVRALVTALFGALVGQPWAQIEGGDRADMRRAVEPPRLARELSDDWSEYARMLPHRRVERFETTLTSELATSAVRKQSEDPRERLAEVALRFASDPGGVRAWADSSKQLRGMINLLLHSKDVARAARYLVLVTTHHLAQDEPSEQGLLYPGWEWS